MSFSKSLILDLLKNDLGSFYFLLLYIENGDHQNRKD